VDNLQATEQPTIACGLVRTTAACEELSQELSQELFHRRARGSGGFLFLSKKKYPPGLMSLMLKLFSC
jgi:hypothetical protein